MKYVLILQGSVDVPEVGDHEPFRRAAYEAGELIGGETLADPSTGRLIGGGDIGSGGIRGIRGYYLVDVENPERAAELAYLLPEARADGFVVEIRPVMYTAGVDY